MKKQILESRDQNPLEEIHVGFHDSQVVSKGSHIALALRSFADTRKYLKFSTKGRRYLMIDSSSSRDIFNTSLLETSPHFVVWLEFHKLRVTAVHGDLFAFLALLSVSLKRFEPWV